MITPNAHRAEALQLVQQAQFEAGPQLESCVALAGLHLIAARILEKLETAE